MADLDLDTTKRYVILDTDMGVDDAWAIFLLLRVIFQLSNVKLLAITCIPGNTTPKNTVRNAFRVLNTFGRTDVRLGH